MRTSLVLAAVLGGVVTTAGSSSAVGPRGGPSTEAQLIGLDQKVAALAVQGRSREVGKLLSPDFHMTHGDQWTYGEEPLFQDTRESYLTRISDPDFYSCLVVGDVEVEAHRDVAMTYGRMLTAYTANIGQPNAYFVIWYIHLYEKKNGKWFYASQRTVKGPHFGATEAEALAGMGPANSELTCQASS
jgi:hypothetical protein